ncbi:hypothetical protein Bbelb_074510 [Branchiostoma belcheri]|nr:hypothetical protein Bbelb_074510 [Branchiostoma belcheri]
MSSVVGGGRTGQAARRDTRNSSEAGSTLILLLCKGTEVTGSSLAAQCGTYGESGVGTRGPVRKKAPHWNSSAETALFQCWNTVRTGIPDLNLDSALVFWC